MSGHDMKETAVEYQRTISNAQGRAGFDEGLRSHMNQVYGLMAVAMLITGLAAWAIAGLATTEDAARGVAQMGDVYLTALGSALYDSPLKWVVMLLPLGMVLLVGSVVERLSSTAIQLFFYGFAVAMGVSLSSIFLVYTGFSIIQTFLVTAIAFASLSLWGYTTKKDISAWGSFLIMGVVGLIVASILNIFLQSQAIQFATSAIGVLIFAGLTAYDTQDIKNNYLQHARSGDHEWLSKSATMGAMNLYLDFINLFMMLLSLFGQRK
jgi:uncharacterized protein